MNSIKFWNRFKYDRNLFRALNLCASSLLIMACKMVNSEYNISFFLSSWLLNFMTESEYQGRLTNNSSHLYSILSLRVTFRLKYKYFLHWQALPILYYMYLPHMLKGFIVHHYCTHTWSFRESFSQDCNFSIPKKFPLANSKFPGSRLQASYPKYCLR